jgi:hypothetical protein
VNSSLGIVKNSIADLRFKKSVVQTHRGCSFLQKKIEMASSLYGEAAVAMGYDAGYFREHEGEVAYTKKARMMQPEEVDKVDMWKTQLKAVTHEQIKQFGTINITKETDEPSSAIVGSGNMSNPATATPSVQPDDVERVGGKLMTVFVLRWELGCATQINSV